MRLLRYKETPCFLTELIRGAGVTGLVVCLQRRRGLGEGRFKLQEALWASAASFPERILVSCDFPNDRKKHHWCSHALPHLLLTAALGTCDSVIAIVR